jgi:hypothetical protein
MILDLEAIENLIENLKADMRERFVRQEEFKALKQRVEDIKKDQDEKNRVVNESLD